MFWASFCFFKAVLTSKMNSQWTINLKILHSLLLFSHQVVSDSLRPHGLEHARLVCPPLSWNLLKFMSVESVMLFPFASSACLQSFQHQSFPVSRSFTSGSQSIGASASVLPVNIQGWFPLGLTGLISLQSKRL